MHMARLYHKNYTSFFACCSTVLAIFPATPMPKPPFSATTTIASGVFSSWLNPAIQA